MAKKTRKKKAQKHSSAAAGIKINGPSTRRTEGDLEASIHGVIRQVFPWLKPENIQHQTRFRIKLGRATVEIDGRVAGQAEGRSDILISHAGQHIAVLELKRNGTKLTPEDEDQGLSYARLLHPRPPLVVVTNGDETRILTSHDGKPLSKDTVSKDQLSGLFSAAAKIASSDVARAVEILLNSDSDMWSRVVQAASQLAIAELSGPWTDPLQPFVAEFLLPRKASRAIYEHLRSRTQVAILQGPALAGKSSVLREITERANRLTEMVVLFVEAGSATNGLLQTLANIFAAALGWPATADQIRAWLRRLSKKEDGPTFVLAIDGVSSRHAVVRQDLDELVSSSFGPNLKFVVSLDSSDSDSLTRTVTVRQSTRLGRVAHVVSLDSLDDQEFADASRILWNMGIGLMHGAALSLEYRVPWLLRTVVADGMSSPEAANTEKVAAVPPLMGLELIKRARERFNDDRLLSTFRLFAECVVNEISAKKPIPLALDAMMAFVITLPNARKRLGDVLLAEAVENGLAKPARHFSGEEIVVPRLPELLASEVAMLLGRELAQKSKKQPTAAAAWLADIVARLPMGDVIGAQAVLDSVHLMSGIPLPFLESLLSKRPTRQPVRPGMKAATNWPGAGTIELQFNEDGSVIASSPSRLPKRLDIDPEDRSEMEMYGSMESWLILSHLAGMQLLAIGATGNVVATATPAILMEVAGCEIPLRRLASNVLEQGYFTHNLGETGIAVCHKSGIVEPITMSMMNALLEGVIDEEWVQSALMKDSFPLLSRLDIALGAVAHLDHEKAKWAHEMQHTHVRSALRKFLAPH